MTGGIDAATPVALVSRDDLERALAGLRATVADPRAGLFGPGSRVWAVNRDTMIFLGGGRAALLQLAHPFVAHAIDQHSTARSDPLGRFLRTFELVFAMIYGDLDAAFAAARRVHGLHQHVTGEIPERVGAFAPGTPYAANVPEALLWVHATLWDTSIQVHELVCGPLPVAEKAAYYQETKRFAALFGIPDAIVPPDWPAFERYVARMLASAEITVGSAARAIAQALLDPPGSWLGPLWRWYAIMTARLLPACHREAFGLAWGASEQAIAEASLQAMRLGVPVLPSRLKWLPAYVDACRRVEGEAPDALGRLLAGMWQRALRARGGPASGATSRQ